MKRGLSTVAVAALLLSAACASGDDGSTPSGGGASAGAAGSIKEGLKIAFLPKQVNNPYFTVSDNGGKAAVEELKGEYKEVGPSEASASSQVSYINTLSQQGTDVIAVSANDPNAICGALNQARQAGAKVVTFDSDTNSDCRDVFVNQATAQGIAENQVKLISDQIGGSGKIAILSATPNATNQNAWIELMKTELKKPEYAKIQLVTVAVRLARRGRCLMRFAPPAPRPDALLTSLRNALQLASCHDQDRPGGRTCDPADDRLTHPHSRSAETRSPADSSHTPIKAEYD